MTYPESLVYLGTARRFGLKLGLEPMRRLASELGAPEKNLRFIHIAGTNGKGSTAAFCESVLRAAGCRVGLYTSPHLITICERIQIDRIPIAEADFAEGMGWVRQAAERAGLEPTFFELVTGLALWHFARENVDWVIWETGLGGRLDATNIVEPRLTVITSIDYDHQRYLGNRLVEIAGEKAGILKPGVPLVCANNSPEVMEVIIARAATLGVPMTRVDEARDLGFRNGGQQAGISGHTFMLGLMGSHQVLNAAVAVGVVRQLHAQGDLAPLTPSEIEAALEKGLAETRWSGRFEIISEHPFIVVDGAHNRAGTESLVQTWRAALARRLGITLEKTDHRAHLIFAAVSDKDITDTARLLSPLAARVSVVRLANERSAEPAILAEKFSGLPCQVFESVAELWLTLQKDPSMPVLIAGSLFLAGEVLALGRNAADEFRLNERLEPLISGR